MNINYLAIAIVGCGISYGLISGVLLAFSDFVMKSLAAIDPFSGARSMQEINRKVYGSVFLALFFIMSIASIIIIFFAYLQLAGSLAFFLMSGGAIYFIGVFLVTIFGNVPMNKKLDAMDPSIMETQQYWKEYIRKWTRLNHIRTVASAVSSTCFFVASITIWHHLPF